MKLEFVIIQPNGVMGQKVLHLFMVNEINADSNNHFQFGSRSMPCFENVFLENLNKTKTGTNTLHWLKCDQYDSVGSLYGYSSIRQYTRHFITGNFDMISVSLRSFDTQDLTRLLLPDCAGPHMWN